MLRSRVELAAILAREESPRRGRHLRASGTPACAVVGRAGRLVEAADVATGQGSRALAADIRFRAARELADKGEPGLAEK
jgi:hypothetical protein